MARAGKPAGTGSIQLGEPVGAFRCFSDVFADGGEVLIGNERMALKRMVTASPLPLVPHPRCGTGPSVVSS